MKNVKPSLFDTDYQYEQAKKEVKKATRQTRNIRQNKHNQWEEV